MKNVAEFKRKMAVGSKWHTMYHGWPPLFIEKDMGVRQLAHVQTNSFAFLTEKGTWSWRNWPKKEDCIFNPNGSITIKNSPEAGRAPLLTYTPIEE